MNLSKSTVLVVSFALILVVIISVLAYFNLNSGRRDGDESAEPKPEINLNSSLPPSEKPQKIWKECGGVKSRNLAEEKRVWLQRHGVELRRDNDAIIVPNGQVVVHKNGMLYYGNKNLSKSDRQVLIEGNTRFYGNKIGQLPRDLFFNGNVTLVKERSDFLLPEKLIVVGHFLLEGDFGRMPEKLIVQEGMTLKAPNAKELPATMMVGKNLDARCSSFSRLPDDFFVGGNTTLIQSGIQELPNNLSVFGDLNLSESPISSLPCGLAVEQALIISGTKIDEVPDDLLVGELLDARNSGISRKNEANDDLSKQVIEKVDYEFYYH